MERRQWTVPRPPLPPRRYDQLAAAAAAAPPAHHDRRRRGETTLRLVAKYADAWNLPFNPDGRLQVLVTKLDVLRGHCDREGRDFATIEKSIMWVGPSPATPDTVAAFADTMTAAAELGVTDVHLMPFDPDPVEFVASVGEHVISALADL